MDKMYMLILETTDL